jgi:hypothetical protein
VTQTPDVIDASGSPTTLEDSVAKAEDKAKKETFGEAFGGALEKLSTGSAQGPIARNAARVSGPTTIAPASLPIPTGPTPLVDPRVVEAQRQQLAMALQRLNKGRLA